MFGMYAAAFSSLFSLFAYLGWIVYRSQKLEPVKLPWRAVSTTAAGVVIVLAVWYWLDHANWTPMMLVYKFSLLVGFVIITLSLESLRQVRDLLTKFLLKLLGRETLKDA